MNALTIKQANDVAREYGMRVFQNEIDTNLWSVAGDDVLEAHEPMAAQPLRDLLLRLAGEKIGILMNAAVEETGKAAPEKTCDLKLPVASVRLLLAACENDASFTEVWNNDPRTAKALRRLAADIHRQTGVDNE